MRRFAASVAAVLIGWLALSGAAAAAPAMWRVSGPHSQIYLFGTLHALSPKAQWRTPLYDQVLAQADTIWFEADMGTGDPATIRAIVQQYGADPQHPLSAKLSPTDLAALSREADVARIDHLRPWAVALMLSMRPVLARGASVQAGADATATRVARGDGKTVRGFETLEDQARMYASLPEASEVQYLTDVIHERNSPPRLDIQPRLPFRPATLEAEWLAGDLARLGPELVGRMKAGNPGLYDALLKRRNLAWADKLAPELNGSGVELVNVGALHMVGDEGLPALLAARGYKVERVQ
ncbi:MAG TPA: TraB/GumN family protein [Phenylobacterium sp.]|nr:TraB/GumN family protein [Phenylobacterium sp.]